MTVFTRWDPFREFTTLQDRLNRLFRESFIGPKAGRSRWRPRALLRRSMFMKTSTTSR